MQVTCNQLQQLECVIATPGGVAKPTVGRSSSESMYPVLLISLNFSSGMSPAKTAMRMLTTRLQRLVESQSICNSLQSTSSSASAIVELYASPCASLRGVSVHRKAPDWPLDSCNSKEWQLRSPGSQLLASSGSPLASRAQGFCTAAAIPATDGTPTSTPEASTAQSALEGSDVATTSGQMHATPVQRNWDWRWVVGNSQSRKPAIKRPQWHQWHYCNPAYDPNQPLPTKMLPPHAPSPVEAQDEWRLFRQIRDQHQALHPSGKDVTPEGYRLSNRRLKRQFLRYRLCSTRPRTRIAHLAQPQIDR